jgi:hypothetical protein
MIKTRKRFYLLPPSQSEIADRGLLLKKTALAVFKSWDPLFFVPAFFYAGAQK